MTSITEVMKIPLKTLWSTLATMVTLSAGQQYTYPEAPAENVAEKAHLFILSGQSNMARLDPTRTFQPRILKEYGEDSVIIVKDAMGAKPIHRWYKEWVSVQGHAPEGRGELYDRLMGQLQPAIQGRDLQAITFLWMQGEQDAAVNQVPVYEAALDGLMSQLRADLGRDDIYLVIGRLSDYSLDSGKHPEWQTMRDLQVRYADADASRAWVNTDDLNTMVDKDGKSREDVHYTKEGYDTFGERLAEKAIALIQANTQQ